MLPSRHPKTALGVALVLLLFTSADLLGDLGGFPVCSSDTAVELHEYLPHDDPAHENSPDQSSEHPEQHHVDDCFCCSHCVQHSAVFHLASVGSIVLLKSDSPLLIMPLFVQGLLRPPQVS